MLKGKVVVIFSGGQDSTTCLYESLKDYERVEAITFLYGQKHAVELDQAREICKRENVKQTEIDMSFLNQINESALISNGDVNEIKENGLPASFVPNRNQLFITLAHAYAQKIGARAIVTGVCQADYSGYPDCRADFISWIEGATNVGSGLYGSEQIRIETPLMDLTKAETFALADQIDRLDDVIEYSHTCYNGDRDHRHEWGYGCGDCPACKLREKGYNEFINHKQQENADIN